MGVGFEANVNLRIQGFDTLVDGASTRLYYIGLHNYRGTVERRPYVI
ncbi:hypothetical protein [Dulcicalothrix desertica]|nr:hypothetical protein [Dulcicalothrix desertica]